MVGTLSKIAAFFGSKNSLSAYPSKHSLSAYPSTTSVHHEVPSNHEKSALTRTWSSLRLSRRKHRKFSAPPSDGVLQSGGKVDKSAPRATSTSDVTPLRSAPPRALETPDVSPILAETPTPDLLVPLSPLESPSIGLTPVKCQPEIRHDPVALGRLKHASLGVEALATLINHLVINYEAFSTPKLKQELEKTKSDWIQTRLQLEQASTTYRRLEEELSIERIKYQETETQHQNEIDDLRKVSRVNERRYEDLEAKLEQQEDELERLRQDHREEIECLNTSHQEELLKASRERSTAENVYKQRIAELEKELTDVQLAHNNLKQSRQLFIDSLSSSEKETKLRAALQRNSELESEVNSLRSVLELRCSELQELRRTSQAWQLHADQLPLAKQTIANYKAKIEQLTEKLDLKEANELKMMKDIKTLNQSLNRGFEQNKRLSMLNEELTWKLKQNTKLVHVLANTVDQASYHSPEMREARLSHKITPFKASDDMELTLTADRGEWLTPTKEIVRYNSNPGNSSVVNLSPSSHKVKGLVEKEDSVSWTLDMDEPVECVASRIIRRATSLRCDQSPRKVQERSRSSKSMSERSIKSEIKNNKEVIVVKDDEELDLLVGPSEITIDDARLRPKSDEELEMLRRVEESGGSLPKDLAGEAMVSGETSDNDSDMVLDDSPIRSPRPVDLIAWHE